MVAIRVVFCFSSPPDSEFVEASPASYSPDELGKSAHFVFYFLVAVLPENCEFGGRPYELS